MFKINNPLPGVIRVGTWGKPIRGLENTWSFGFEQGYMLKKLTITQGDVGICSLMFTTAERNGVLHTSNELGDSDGAHTVSEVSKYILMYSTNHCISYIYTTCT